MNCSSCSDNGISLIVYEDGSKVFAVCLCAIGERWRRTETFQNHSGEIGKAQRTDPLWHVWAFEHHVPLSQMRMLEDAVTPEELAARGFAEITAETSMDAIAAAARSRKVGR